ncbi:uncharacterized protein I206_104999 [Kwoniella pini CBS 10737]|uniref:Scavenger mRNA-decapping enzyme DcpS n=1 Tax=Kwoniella pini CBS 10737 TaxID=1296096 RepID=A0A1B9I8B9_9TREE|nr:uncharacterized protein I206_02538 [Kwoniella pini CBS 10737]OCF51822.1 hypothetical protein I206_02538 [Kwoniella pini CBS 10737]
MSSSTPTPSAPEGSLEISVQSLATFTPTRILSESTLTGSVYILGTLHNLPTIIHLQKTILDIEKAGDLIKDLEKIDLFLENQPYFSSHGWIKNKIDKSPELQIKIICPATDIHIKKYSKQERFIIIETPELYEKVVLNYINGFDESRLGWVYAILNGQKESERILYRKENEKDGFVILPDLKWDQTSMNALYLTVLVQTRTIRSLRDLDKSHIPLLNSIKQAVFQTVKQKYQVGAGKLRLFVHYQPSYYHFHVHVVHIQSEAFSGMLVGQAHMLDDLITLLELSPSTGPSLLAQKTFTYPLGVEHGLYEGMKAAGAILD